MLEQLQCNLFAFFTILSSNVHLSVHSQLKQTLMSPFRYINLMSSSMLTFDKDHIRGISDIFKDYNIMATQSKIKFEKYSALRGQLVNDDSDSDDETNQITQLICQLLPAYYQYRKYLVQMLRQANVNQKTYASLILPNQYLEDKLKKCAEEKIICEQRTKNKTSGRVTRSLVTEKVLQKQRKKVTQQRQLLKKYEAQQIEALIKRGYSNDKMQQQQQQTFEPNKIKSPKAKNDQRKSLQHEHRPVPNLTIQRPFFSSNDAVSPKNNRAVNKIKKTSILDNENITNLKKVVEQVKAEGGIMGQSDEISQNSMNSSKIIEKVRNSNIHVVEAKSQDQINGKDNKVYQRPNEKQPAQRLSAPKIRINYHNKQKSDSSQLSEEDLSQQNDFLSEVQQLGPSKQTSNIVEVQHHADDTYSEHKGLRPYLRHNTPNFDTQSQKIKPTNFFQLQQQKLQAQKQKAQRLQNEVSVVLGQQTSSLSQTSNQNKQYSNLNLQALVAAQQHKQQQNTTGRLSTQQIIDQFIYSIKYMLTEICQLYCHAQEYLFLLKNKQYQVLKVLYSEDVGKGPIFSKNIVGNIGGLLDVDQRKSVQVIVRVIFGKEAFIDFQEFSKVFYTPIMSHQYALLNSKVTQISPHNITQLIKRLFSVWLQINYFEQKIRRLSQTNSMQINHLCSKVTKQNDQSTIDLDQTQKFLYSTSKNRTNSLKVKLFFSNYFPQSKFKNLVDWLQQKEMYK